jgi:hypothetical protein
VRARANAPAAGRALTKPSAAFTPSRRKHLSSLGTAAPEAPPCHVPFPPCPLLSSIHHRRRRPRLSRSIPLMPGAIPRLPWKSRPFSSRSNFSCG